MTKRVLLDTGMLVGLMRVEPWAERLGIPIVATFAQTRQNRYLTPKIVLS